MNDHALVDTFQRKIDYLRISITDNCNLKCKCCSPSSSGRTHLHRRDILTYEEIAVLAEAAVAAGISRIRLTGGESLIRIGACKLPAIGAGLGKSIRNFKSEVMVSDKIADKQESH